MKPAAVILDLLRTYPHRGAAVRTIMATGALFGLNDNLMRVNLSRLVGRGLVENFERGFYRLADSADPLNDFVEEWRLGEKRVRTWDAKSWLLVHTSRTAAPKRRWALEATGFREVSDRLWLRPDNLARDLAHLQERLGSLGLDQDSILVEGARMQHPWPDAWLAQFDVERMTHQYQRCRDQLIASQHRLADLSPARAQKESFDLGGKAVHILAKDPLLPAQILDPGPRRELWQTMLAYDRVGRGVWGGKPVVMPTPQLQVVEAGIQR